jgi:hypothetical protein
MPRRALIVSPGFPPVNVADGQRVRMSLPFFRENGWEPHVLAVEPRFVEGCHEPALLQTVPEDIPVTRVAAIPPGWTRRFGFGSLGLRAFVHLRAAGDRLLRQEHFDLVYFSTTVFTAMTLGPLWKKKFGIPYVLDFQDPWLNDYYAKTGHRPPGGRWKYAWARWQAGRSEPTTVRQADHIIAVSPAYPELLRSRYPDVREDRFTVLPFGGAEHDFQTVHRVGIRQRVFDPEDGRRHWVYLGRGGSDMLRSVRALFQALRGLRNQSEADDEDWKRLRVHFVGTRYAAHGGGEGEIARAARDLGVADMVQEQPQRIPYLEGLALLQASDAVLIVGSDDPGYTASKVFPCVLSGRPLLAILHEASSAGGVLSRCRPGSVVTFRSEEASDSLAPRVRPLVAALLARPRQEDVPFDKAAFEPYTARTMTRRQCEVFDRVLARDHGVAHRRVPALVGAGGHP